ncbi:MULTISPECIES: HAD-IA family hydrolase [Novosphingobium]|uniref:HAD-IA family hydrolase n=1 Tax=Novosphingobium decolorationis TaxID=2698673 RepID=A0ABX8E2M0_9SPHN|nr:MULTISPECIES: HAD-IA family hydrolase [Novosphingobium]MED5545186.1 HAD-IA family hydrolase [Pseudomonadota bacterium]QVM83385.1 HAD-IA family hydrolase [Novosphingobium decolorationis]GAM05753.1 phosphoglycolate phosphatase [Novosphingobium sp. MBES04]
MKLAVFDCDGTLIDGQAAICEAMEATFAAHDLTAPPRATIRRAVGLSLPQAMRALLPESDGEQQHAMAETYKQAFRQARTEGRVSQPLFEGIRETLEALKAAGWTLAVATGMSDRGLAHCLANNGIAELFVSLQTADRHPSKPHPAMLEEAMFEAGANAEQTVMIGDTAYDMEMAKAAWVRGVGVDWGYHHPEELMKAGAEFVAETPDQLRAHLLA